MGWVRLRRFGKFSFTLRLGRRGEWKEWKGKQGKERDFLCLDNRGEKKSLFGNIILVILFVFFKNMYI